MPDDDEELDDRVSPDTQISFTRDPQLAHDLVTGPYPYARSEQDAIEDACKDVMKQYRRGTRPEAIFTHLLDLAADTEGELTIRRDSEDLTIERKDLDIRLRFGLRGGDMWLGKETIGEES